jgi:DNA-binding NtrC family response regulator
MPNIVFDVRTSHEDRLSTLRQGGYHTLITDTTLVHANQCSILKEALSAPCPVPVLISAKAGEIGAVIPALDEGVLDIIADPPSGRQASLTIRQALWLYRLRIESQARESAMRKVRLLAPPP